jgi:phosphotriesterase-related protein
MAPPDGGMTQASYGEVRTVNGPIDPSELGITMTHEHLYCDLRCWQANPWTSLQEELADKPIAIEMLGELRRDALVFRDNLLLEDESVALDELRDLMGVGGTALVELTVNGLEPRANQLRTLADELDLHILSGCGHYIKDSHPQSVETTSVDSLTEALLEEIDAGIGESGVRPGVIGEIGTGQPVHRDEWKVLEAACQAQRASGLPMFVHVYPMADGRTAPEVVQFALDLGVTATRINICHMDGQLDLAYLMSVLDMGVVISFDTFGLEAYYDSIDRRSSFDADREAALIALLERGYGRQLLISQDVCMKMQLRRYGGQGYSHILRHVVPSLKRHGVGGELIDMLLRENPARFLTVERPSEGKGLDS